MGKQLELGLPDVEASLEKCTVPEQKRHEPEPYAPHPVGAPLKPAGLVTLIHRTGRVKQVNFSQVAGGRAWVVWPVSHDQLGVSLKTGYVVVPKKLGEWRLEASALCAARRLYRRERGTAVDLKS